MHYYFTKYIAALFAVFAALGIAESQQIANPFPPTSYQVAGFVDAGNANINGLLTSGTLSVTGFLDAGNANINGSLTSGTISVLNTLSVDGGINMGSGGFIGSISGLGGYTCLWGVPYASATTSNYQVCAASGSTIITGGSGSLLLGADGTYNLASLSNTVFAVGVAITTPEVVIGSGTAITNHCVNVCSLSSQTCNLPCSGATGNSVCHAWSVSSPLACDVRADAGSATVTCAATVTGDAGVECFN